MDGQYLPDEIDIDSLSSSEPPEFLVQEFSRGGEASLDSSTESMNKYLLAEEEASPMAYATVPTEPQAPEMDMSTAKSMLKRLATKGERGKSSRPKGMGMELGDLTPAIPEIGAPPTEQEKLVKIATARSQFDAMERAYKLKAIAAAKSSKGLSRPTFNALAFDQPTLEKPGPLMAKTFQFGGLVKGMKAMGKRGAPDPAQLMPSSAARGAEEAAVASPSIIKDEGGNWMKGPQSVENFVKPLKKGAHEVDPRIAGQLGIAPDPKQKSLNQWIDKKMTPYIKNKMATPSDPLRKLAEEEGILPFPDLAVNGEVTANINRKAAGLPVEQQAPLAKTERGQAWENRADAAINVAPYNEMIPAGYSDNISSNMDEVLRAFGGEFAVQNPTAKVSGMNTGRGATQLGFDHVIDVLQESMTTGRLSADSLRGLSMEDAVRLTHQYDQDMAKKMAEASIQSLKDVPVYKQYPEQGFRWMQLDKPGYFAAESDAMGHSVRGYEPPVGHPDWTPQSGNKGNLSYGSYGGWEAIKKGDVKIYSLADDQGKRYTTVEAVKAKHPFGYSMSGGNIFPRELRQDFPQDAYIKQFGSETIPKEKLQEIYALGKKMYFENPNSFSENRILSGAARPPSPMDSFQKAADQVIGELPFDIAQIKGQVNTSVAQDAQPFVQDFLNSGNWSEVSDLSKTGLRDIAATPELEKFVKANNQDNRRFLTEAEYNTYENDFLRGELTNQLGGFDPIKRAEGSPVTGEGELTQEEIDAASKPAFITPSSGRGRKEGNISKALASGKAYSAAAKGVTELPYDLLGLPMDLTMLARQALTGLEPTGQIGTSDYIKKQMTGLGIRPEPPADPTEKGFYTAGELLSNFANPAAVTRGGVKLAQKTGQAAGDAAKTLEDLTVGEVQRARVRKAGKKAENIPDTAYDPLRERLEATGNLSYAVRPTGSMMNTLEDSGLSNFIKNAQDRVKYALPDNLDKAERTQKELLIKDFWQTKAKNYFEKQFGTPNDPISDLIKTKRIKGPLISDRANFPGFLVDQLTAGKTRVREAQRPSPDFTGPMQIDPAQTRFFPKYPDAFEEFTNRYDTQTGLTGALVSKEPGLTDKDYTFTTSPLGKQRVDEARQATISKLIEQGVDPTLINPSIDLSTRSIKDSNYVVGPTNARSLYKQYESSPGFIGKMLGEGPSLPQELLTAIEKKEPIYDIDSFGPALKELFKEKGINNYLASLSERELKNAQFPDVVQATNASRQEEQTFLVLDDRIRKGKSVPNEVYETGVSAPLGQVETGPYEGYSWKQLETAASTVPEGAYIGHSVGGYAIGGLGYSPEKMEAFKQGRYQVYSLRDNRNRPVTTVEVYMVDENTPVVKQIRGNGRATGNTAPEKYDNLVRDFFQDYLNPRSIEEKDEFLTPILKKYRDTINSTFSMP